MKKPRIRESHVVNSCIKWLYLHGVYCWRQNTGAYKPEGSNSYVRYGLPGSADIIGLTRGGRMIAVECKGTGGILSGKQVDFGYKIMFNNGIYIVAYSIDDLEKRRHEIVD